MRVGASAVGWTGFGSRWSVGDASRCISGRMDGLRVASRVSLRDASRCIASVAVDVDRHPAHDGDEPGEVGDADGRSPPRLESRDRGLRDATQRRESSLAELVSPTRAQERPTDGDKVSIDVAGTIGGTRHAPFQHGGLHRRSPGHVMHRAASQTELLRREHCPIFRRRSRWRPARSRVTSNLSQLRANLRARLDIEHVFGLLSSRK